MSKASRILGWSLLAALVFVTVCPIGLRPVSEAPVWLERFGAFALLGFLFALGYPKHRWQVLVLTAGAAGGLELLQVLQPSRHGRVPDFLVKVAGGCFGAAAALAVSFAQRLSAMAAFKR
ncbi:VanZ family protein [Methylobacterium planeticum]|uniref:VanZ family protein n=1 Tax=Methylobacterium planeticum TaxID=2615211 RepID=A0A6N6MKE4_9HYPH|nr:VanZ family protein [Methylobacterium planeticum]KAB1071648.1 VanZ family protein [Methylobacterium planeticum]